VRSPRLIYERLIELYEYAGNDEMMEFYRRKLHGGSGSVRAEFFRAMKSLKGAFSFSAHRCSGGVGHGRDFFFSRNVDVVILTQTRLTISFLLMAAAFLLFRRDLLVINVRDLYKFFLLGVIGELGSMFTYYFTIEQTNVATAILLQYLAPLFVLAYAAISRTERLTTLKVMLGFSFAGSLAIAGNDLSPSR
jgi:hypothetical protein